MTSIWYFEADRDHRQFLGDSVLDHNTFYLDYLEICDLVRNLVSEGKEETFRNTQWFGESHHMYRLKFKFA